MKTWQMFLVGTTVLIAVLFLPIYEQVLAGVAAVVFIAAVAYGFALQPKREVFHIRAKTPVHHPDRHIIRQRELIAVKLEIVNLWALFIPTMAAVSFLAATAAQGTTFHFRFLGRILDAMNHNGYIFFLAVRIGLMAVAGAVSIWIGERRALRDADAESAMTARVVGDGYVEYVFLDSQGSYYGGISLVLRHSLSPVLGRLVFYDVKNPDLNKIAMSLFFHCPEIVAHGLTDLDSETAATHAKLVEEGIT